VEGYVHFCFVHAADLHLDTPFEGIGQAEPGVADALRDASLDAFDALVELAIIRNAAFVVFAGDIYDGAERGIRAQVRFHRGLQSLSDAGIWSFVVHGNHDPVATGWSAIRADWPPLVKIFTSEVEGVTVERDGEPIAKVYGVSFAKRAEIENLALRFPTRSGPELHVGVLHCNLGGVSDHDSYAPCSVDDLRCPDYDYWALGHIHVRTTVRDSDPCIAYPGNLQGRSPKASERGAKGALVVDVDDRTVHPPRFVPLDVVRFQEIEVDISGFFDLPSLEAQLIHQVTSLRGELDGRSAIVRVALTGHGPIHRDLAREGAIGEVLHALRDDTGTDSPFIFWESMRDETLTELDLDSTRKRSDFSSELLKLADELMGNEERLAGFVKEHTADLHGEVLAHHGVRIPDATEADAWSDASIAALETLAGARS